MAGDKGKTRAPRAEAGTARAEERLVDLELRFMKLERFALELSHAVAEQQGTIDALVKETKRLRERFPSFAPLSTIFVRDVRWIWWETGDA